MKFKTIATAAAVLTFINAVFFLFAPVFSLGLLGRDTNLTGIMNTRISGACALGLAVLAWLIRDIKYTEVQRLVSYAMLITFCLLVVIDLNGIMNGAINELGWTIFIADLCLALGFSVSIFTAGGRKN